jgi:hypothetical protein
MTLKPNTLDWLRTRVVRIEAEVKALDDETLDLPVPLEAAQKALNVAKKALALLEMAMMRGNENEVYEQVEEACQWLIVRGWGK